MANEKGMKVTIMLKQKWLWLAACGRKYNLQQWTQVDNAATIHMARWELGQVAEYEIIKWQKKWQNSSENSVKTQKSLLT